MDIPNEFWQDEDFRKILWFELTENKAFGITRHSGHIALAHRTQRKISISWVTQWHIDYQYPSLDFFERFHTGFISKNFGQSLIETVADFALLFQKDIDPLDVLNVQNMELRRCLFKQVGYEKIKDVSSYFLIDKVGNYELFSVEFMHYLKMKDSSHDIDYVLAIPQHDIDIVGNKSNPVAIVTVRHALAWSFSIHPLAYEPKYET